eukprot:TRINITY_DN5238_c0_g1_i4.p1 TRINITY_DN5238_c0_g1~~TRINITY_DN5238_c0_g1_i4.p1  ORF type:complete len:690 (-),score=273.95 TRINITY_DN5238_c0_g1_i4:174-2243(-)
MSIQRDPYNFSAPLYEKYVQESFNYLTERVCPSLVEAHRQNDVTFLREWMRRWDNQAFVVRGLSNIFTYLDRYYTPANTETCPPLKTKGWNMYKETVYDQFKQPAREAILLAIQRERDSENQDQDLLQKAVRVFIEMGFKQSADNGIALYKNDFERLLIEQTTDHYRSKARIWLAQDSCPDYMTKAEACILAEEARVQAYLHQSSKEPLLAACQRELLSNVQDELLSKETGTNALLEQNATADLGRMYRLFSRVPNGLEGIAAKVREHIRRLGEAVIAQSKNEDGPDTNHAFVRNLMQLHDQYLGLVRRCFDNSQVFQKALKEAFEDFINKEYHTSRLLAKYINDVLKKGSKVDVADIENTLDNVVMLYGYIREKDVFERDYQVFLSTRLLQGLSESEHSEKAMIAKLKTECGYQWTSKLEGMFKDVQLSKDICQGFTSLHGRKFNVELDVNVCTTGYWPTSNVPPCTMPVEIQPLCQAFKQYYLTTHSGRRLEWRMDQGQADIKVRFSPETTRDLTISTYQMVVMLLFNHEDVFTFHQIAQQTDIPREALETHILSLAHPKYKVLLKNPPSKNLNDDDTFQINAQFTSKLYKTKIPLMKTVKEAKEEESEKERDIEVQRRHQVDAAVVRIMKTRKTLPHVQLFTEVVQQLASRFQPKPQLIKQRIEHLIEMEYLERDKNDRTLYHYLA